MEQPLYLFLMWTARESGLLWMVQEHQDQILTGVALLALVCCLFGFYCYRAVVSGLAFLGVTLGSFLCIDPMWGTQAAVTSSAVLGVIIGFLAFRWYRLGGVVLCALIAGSWVWQATGGSGMALVLAALAALLAGLITFFFPLWGICGFTAVWGAVAFAQEGWRVWSLLPSPEQPLCILLAIVLAVVGLALQMLLFRRQKLFARIMPQKLEYRLQKRREKRGVAA